MKEISGLGDVPHDLSCLACNDMWQDVGQLPAWTLIFRIDDPMEQEETDFIIITWVITLGASQFLPRSSCSKHSKNNPAEPSLGYNFYGIRTHRLCLCARPSEFPAPALHPCAQLLATRA